MTFRDRIDAGRQLGELVRQHALEDPLVLALSRGGVPVASEVARALRAPLDVIVARKLGVPGRPELGVGAITEGEGVFVDETTVRLLAISADELAEIAERESVELQRCANLYRKGRPLPPLSGHDVVLVDDGVATGITARAAIRALRRLDARKVILAVPLIAAATAEEIRAEVDELIAVSVPEHFGEVGYYWYEDFPQTTDAEVLSLLGRGQGKPQASAGDAQEEVRIPSEAGVLQGLLGIPSDPWGVVIFAHASDWHGRRTQHLARRLRQTGLATLLVDLLAEHEETSDQLTGQSRFDVDLLADRLIAATQWTGRDERLRHLPVGYFGASAGGGAAALLAATQFVDRVRAVVSCCGRPDLVGASDLVRVALPTLALVGSRDPEAIELHREAMGKLLVEHRLAIVAGAGHLFQEPGTLDSVGWRSAEWFAKHLTPIETPVWPEGRAA